MKKNILLFYLLLLSFGSLAQRLPDIALNNKVIVNRADETIYTYINTDKQSFNPKLSNTYYWFSAGQIKTTQGGYSGKLLNGSYESFYPDKTLKEKGAFKNGLKNGEWCSWYNSGNLKAIRHWSKGTEAKSFIDLDEQGRRIKEGKLKNKLFYGKTYQYLPSDSVIITKYSKDKVVKKRESEMKRKFKYYYKRLFGKREDKPVINASAEIK